MITMMSSVLLEVGHMNRCMSYVLSTLYFGMSSVWRRSHLRSKYVLQEKSEKWVSWRLWPQPPTRGSVRMGRVWAWVIQAILEGDIASWRPEQMDGRDAFSMCRVIRHEHDTTRKVFFTQTQGDDCIIILSTLPTDGAVMSPSPWGPLWADTASFLK